MARFLLICLAVLAFIVCVTAAPGVSYLGRERRFYDGGYNHGHGGGGGGGGGGFGGFGGGHGGHGGHGGYGFGGLIPHGNSQTYSKSSASASSMSGGISLG